MKKPALLCDPGNVSPVAPAKLGTASPRILQPRGGPRLKFFKIFAIISRLGTISTKWPCFATTTKSSSGTCGRSTTRRRCTLLRTRTSRAAATKLRTRSSLPPYLGPLPSAALVSKPSQPPCRWHRHGDTLPRVVPRQSRVVVNIKLRRCFKKLRFNKNSLFLFMSLLAVLSPIKLETHVCISSWCTCVSRLHRRVTSSFIIGF
jgi:hypothetical protein